MAKDFVVTWVPSKKAIEGGFPAGVDPNTAYNMPYSEVHEDSAQAGFNRWYRHRMNNEAYSAMLSGESTAKEKNESFDRVSFLHDYRIRSMNEIREGKVGLRAPSEAVITDPVEEEANNRAFDYIKTWLNKTYGDGTFTYARRDARSLKWANKEGQTLADLIARLLSTEKPTKRGTEIWAKARETIAAREAEKAGVSDEENPFEDAAE